MVHCDHKFSYFCFRRTPPASADRGRSSREAPRRNSLERLNELIGTSSEFGRGVSIGGGSRTSGDVRHDATQLRCVVGLMLSHNLLCCFA